MVTLASAGPLSDSPPPPPSSSQGSLLSMVQPGAVRTGQVRRVVFEDPSLPHQIVLRLAQRSHRIAVSCNCMRANDGSIEIRGKWTAAEAIAAWRAHLDGDGQVPR